MNINNLKLIKAMIISLSSVFAVSFFHNDNLFIFNENFFISFCIYTILFYVALFGYEINKVVGILLFISTTLFSQNMWQGNSVSTSDNADPIFLKMPKKRVFIAKKDLQGSMLN